ncbi:nucleopolyhedrovirus P10 family protein [Streptomyces sp. NPDC048172]|uniref:nucleopolyhedrovirus P10 family protein n=1 Tax=Streptomyces sp. NPDC048172 TaxID=3365505 RepID=UPI00372329A9
MGADRLTQAVRHQLGLGRLLPLGEAGDGAWLTEETARGVLRRAAARAMPGVRLDTLRLAEAGPEDPEEASESAVPAPPSALPPGPLQLEATLAVTVEEPLPVVTGRLRTLLLAAADEELGLAVASADLRVTDLLLEAPEPEPEPEDEEQEQELERPEEQAESEAQGEGEGEGLAADVAPAVLAVPGVARPAPVLGSPLTLAAGDATARAVRVQESDGAPPHLLLQLAVAPGHRALDVARAARAAATKAADREVTVAVLITAVERA